MKIILKNSLASLEVNTNGAYIDNFEVKDTAVFFPKVMVKIGDVLKIRGGMHVCAPNFGVDERLNTLPSHGFGRDLLWEIIQQQEDFVKLSLEGIEDYEDVSFILTYRLEKSSLFLKLEIENDSDEKKLIAPGFHPYFYSDHSPVLIENEEIDKEALPNSIYIDGKDQSFISNNNDIEIIGLENINKYVIWSDFKGDYICVEPTYDANSFEDENKNVYELASGERFGISAEIKVNI